MSEPLIVVPLDTSELSEGALPYAASIAKATKWRVLLVTVWEGADRALVSSLPDLADDVFQQGEQHYEQYLAGVAARLEQQGIKAEAEVLTGEADDAVLELIDEREPRLLALASHGRSGISRWLYGSVTSKLVRSAPVPTLVVGPKALESGPEAGALRRILVPLDGSELSETALAPAAELGAALGAEIVLAQVLRWATQAFVYGVPEVEVTRIDDELMKAAKSYLAAVRERFPKDLAVEALALHGMPADALIDLSDDKDVDLVVMASHGRAGLARAALGSVADRMLQGSAPVLLIRPLEQAHVSRAPVGRYCHNCGRAVGYGAVDPEDRCLRCGQHLRACGNCVYFDGITCLLGRSEVRDTYPGRDCPRFQFRESEAPAASGDD